MADATTNFFHVVPAADYSVRAGRPNAGLTSDIKGLTTAIRASGNRGLGARDLSLSGK